MDYKWTGTLPDVTSEVDFSQTMREAAEKTYESVMETLRSGGRPTTFAAKWAKDHKSKVPSFLHESGKLYAAIRKGWDKTSFAVSISKGEVPYCFAQHFGYAPNNLPARPYMMFQDKDKEDIQALFMDRLVEFFETRRKPIGTQS